MSCASAISSLATWNKQNKARGFYDLPVLAEDLYKLILDADDLHIGDSLAHSPSLEVVFLKRVDEDVLGSVLCFTNCA